MADILAARLVPLVASGSELLQLGEPVTAVILQTFAVLSHQRRHVMHLVESPVETGLHGHEFFLEPRVLLRQTSCAAAYQASFIRLCAQVQIDDCQRELLVESARTDPFLAACSVRMGRSRREEGAGRHSHRDSPRDLRSLRSVR